MVDMSEREYDPAVYGHVKADFLNRLSGMPPPENEYANEEKQRDELLKEIREGKLVVKKD